MKSGYWLGCILLIGILLRLVGIDFGFPIVSNLYIRPDESLIVEPALHLFERWGDPRFYIYPALVIEITAVFYQVYWLLSNHLDSMVVHFAANPNPYFFIPRLISVFAGTVNIYFVYILGRYLTNRTGALAAALLFATAPLAVRDSHFGVTDTPMALFLTLAAITYLRFRQSENRRDLLLSPGYFGLAAASKYTALLLGPRMVLATLLDASKERNRAFYARLVAFLFIPVAVFFLLNPYIIPNFKEVFLEIVSLLKIFYLRQEGDPPWSIPTALMQIFRPLQFGPGEILGLGFCLVGLGFSFRSRKSSFAGGFLGGYILLHLLALVPFQHTVPFRYLIPVLPFLAVFAGKGLIDSMEVFTTGIMRKTIILVFFLACGISLTRSLWLDLLMVRTDTRVLAGQYIQESVSVDTPVVYLCGPESEPQVPENADSLLRRMEYVDRRYGEKAGDFISRLYRDLMQRPEINRRGWPIYRFPDPEEIAFQEPIVIVTATHPLDLGNTAPDLISRWAVEPLLTRDFISIEMTETAVFDRIDGFFLPFTELWKVERPGPNLRVMILKWSSSQADGSDKFVPGSESAAR